MQPRSYLLTGGSTQFGWNTFGHVSQLISFPFLPHTMHTLSMVFCKQRMNVKEAKTNHKTLPYSGTRSRTNRLRESPFSA